MCKNQHEIKFVKISPQCNRLLRWCPYPDCNYAIKVQYPDARPVMCKCRKVFCFNCGENWHDPVKCHLLKRWIKKCDDDSETSNWIAANTKVGVDEGYACFYEGFGVIFSSLELHYIDFIQKYIGKP